MAPVAVMVGELLNGKWRRCATVAAPAGPAKGQGVVQHLHRAVALVRVGASQQLVDDRERRAYVRNVESRKRGVGIGVDCTRRPAREQLCHTASGTLASRAFALSSGGRSASQWVVAGRTVRGVPEELVALAAAAAAPLPASSLPSDSARRGGVVTPPRCR